MKLQRFQRGVLWVFMLVCISKSANAAPAKDAKAEARAVAYQAEARTIFSGRGWRIARDKPGVLIMEHNIGFASTYGGQISADFVDTNVSGIAQIIVTFKPESAVDTSCAIDARQYSKRKEQKEGFRVLTEDDLKPLTKDTHLSGPSPIKNQEMLQTITDLLGKARKRLTREHPEFAAK